MELRHTLEILTKDIQDIEKLVGNLQNSTPESSIELDLALSKLRNVYEVLTLIKADRLQELIQSVPEPSSGSDTSGPETRTAPEDKVADQDRGRSGPAEKKEENRPAQDTDPEAVAQKSSADGGDAAPGQVQEQPKEKAILAEKFSAESSINENMAGQRKGGQESRLVGQPIDSIHRNIGINDRFLIIRELFAGDADGFRDLIQQLDGAVNYEKASELLKERFPASEEHEGIEILAGLIKRRFTTV